MIPFLLDTVITPSSGEAAKGAAEAAGAAQSATFMSGAWMQQHPAMLIVFYVVVLLLIMYFLSIRPTQKREKKLAEMRNAIEVGDSIVTNSGFYGKVVDVTYDCLIVEFGLNKGVRIPIAKTEVYGKAEPNMSNEAPAVEEEPKKKGLFRKG